MAEKSLTDFLTEISLRLNEQERKVLKFTEVKSLLGATRNRQQRTVAESIKALVENGMLLRIDISFGVRQETRFIRGNPTPYELAMLIRPKSYLTHQTAMELNRLTAKRGKTIYANVEQPPKDHSAEPLEQENIDNAFRVNQRQSKSRIFYKNKEIRLLSGMNTSSLGVVQTSINSGVTLVHTDLERTLIDITVRPAYSGGVRQVLLAYKKASSKLTLDKLIKYLAQLDYKYPYHQAVGFYLSQTGFFRDDDLASLKQIGLKYDFYLSHAMQETTFDSDWRIHYPQNLNIHM